MITEEEDGPVSGTAELLQLAQRQENVRDASIVHGYAAEL